MFQDLEKLRFLHYTTCPSSLTQPNRTLSHHTVPSNHRFALGLIDSRGCQLVYFADDYFLEVTGLVIVDVTISWTLVTISQPRKSPVSKKFNELNYQLILNVVQQQVCSISRTRIFMLL